MAPGGTVPPWATAVNSMSPVFSLYRVLTRYYPPWVKRNSLILQLLLIHLFTCLPSRCLVMKAYSDSTIPAFRRHVTISKWYYRTFWSSSNALDLYSRGVRFESWPGNRLAPNSGFPWSSSLPPGKCRDLDQDMTTSFHILSNSSFTCPPLPTLYKLQLLTS
jgi:hypothetical protein